jgi:hypothetical protein
LDYPSPDNFNVNGELGYSLVCFLTNNICAGWDAFNLFSPLYLSGSLILERILYITKIEM